MKKSMMFRKKNNNNVNTNAIKTKENNNDENYSVRDCIKHTVDDDGDGGSVVGVNVDDGGTEEANDIVKDTSSPRNSILLDENEDEESLLDAR